MGVKVFILTMILLFPTQDNRPASIENFKHFGVFFQHESCQQEAEKLAVDFNQYVEQRDFEGYAYFSCLEVDIPANY